MEIPIITLPKIQKIDTVEIPLPEADVPYYTPMVVPPSDLRDQEAKPVRTEEIVLGWVKTKLGTDEVAAIEKSLEDQIALINTPVSATGKPW